MVRLMPLPSPDPNHLLPHLIPDRFYLSGVGLPRLSWKRGRQTGVVVVVIYVYLRYGDSVDNTVGENSSVFSLIRMRWLQSAMA